MSITRHALVAATVALSTACSTPPSSAPRGLRQVPVAVQQQAQRSAQGVIDLLDNGNEETAKAELKRILALDPYNKLAQSLQRQITADPMAVLGRDWFIYVVRPNDTLTSLASRYLGDANSFYILARYNDIRVPNQMASGQQIRIPGRAPAPLAAEPRRPSPPPATVVDEPRRPSPPPAPAAAEPRRPSSPPAPVVAEPRRPSPPSAPVEAVRPAPPPAEAMRPSPPLAEAPRSAPPATEAVRQPPSTRETVPPPASPAEQAVRQAEAAEGIGDLDGALAGYRRAAALNQPGASARADGVRRKLVAQHSAAARGALARQDLDGSIRLWERVLAVDPGNDTARLERQRAIGLREKVRALK